MKTLLVSLAVLASTSAFAANEYKCRFEIAGQALSEVTITDAATDKFSEINEIIGSDEYQVKYMFKRDWRDNNSTIMLDAILDKNGDTTVLSAAGISSNVKGLYAEVQMSIGDTYGINCVKLSK